MARNQIFVSYRRQDSRPWAARLIDDLRDSFGRERVFRDIDSNRGGQDYVRQIAEAIKGVWEENYASGFLNNVQALLEGRGIGQDSAPLPGVSQWRNRSREV